MSVLKDLDNIVCTLKLDGTFPKKKPVETGLKKVIPYSKPLQDFDSYAVVGETVLDYANTCEKKKDYDVIVGILNERCVESYVFQYGGKKRRLEEQGLSIAQVTTQGELAITGNVKKWKNCDETKFDDILVFRLKVSGIVRWWRYYNVKNKVST